jgi:2-dehydro-3-deoxyphosphogluconate aldolase/(4S)-4-hydroxy-2-oxoglutarate aldolase
MRAEEVLQRLGASRVIAVLTLPDPAHAEPIAHALAAGGVTAVELTLRTATALESLRRMRAARPELLVGAGTVLTPAQVDQAQRAGACYGVAPGLNPRVLQAARDSDFPFAPGVATPSDIEAALEWNCRTMKFFPAEPMGGLPYLRSAAAPYRHLGVRFIPLGGVTEETLAAYLKEPLVAAVGGSWLVPESVLASGDWADVEQRARRATAIAAAAARTPSAH